MCTLSPDWIALVVSIDFLTPPPFRCALDKSQSVSARVGIAEIFGSLLSPAKRIRVFAVNCNECARYSHHDSVHVVGIGADPSGELADL